MSIQQFFNELYALEFHELGVVFDAAIQRHTDFPGPRKHFWILDRGFVHQGVGAARSITLHHMYSVGVEISGPVEPSLIVEACYVDDERIPVPSPVGPSHPTVDGSLLRLAHI